MWSHGADQYLTTRTVSDFPSSQGLQWCWVKPVYTTSPRHCYDLTARWRLNFSQASLFVAVPHYRAVWDVEWRLRVSPSSADSRHWCDKTVWSRLTTVHQAIFRLSLSLQSSEWCWERAVFTPRIPDIAGTGLPRCTPTSRSPCRRQVPLFFGSYVPWKDEKLPQPGSSKVMTLSAVEQWAYMLSWSLNVLMHLCWRSISTLLSVRYS